MKSKDLQPRLVYPARLSFRIEGKTKRFPDEKKLKEFIPTKPVLQELLKGFLEEEKNTFILSTFIFIDVDSWIHILYYGL